MNDDIGWIGTGWLDWLRLCALMMDTIDRNRMDINRMDWLGRLCSNIAMMDMIGETRQEHMISLTVITPKHLEQRNRYPSHLYGLGRLAF